MIRWLAIYITAYWMLVLLVVGASIMLPLFIMCLLMLWKVC
ncbi:hypothetical protein [Brochothrix phage ADU4]|uniref:Gp179 n=1 Tax=Brochothrix phage A9 TaxID=857312 RepID=D9J0X7_9CAUD|nr:gp179 [Brochothrix phage A9]ADJ53214.1 gp179 [Brochothrix phage A9]UKM96519.1 hypothetical protein [Brochothrix phage ADU4]